MNRKTLVLLGIVVIAAQAYSQARAPSGRRETAPGRPARHEARALGDELGLTEEKRVELGMHMNRMRERMASLKTEHDAAREKLERLLDAGQAEESEIWRAVDEVNRTAGEMLKARVTMKLEIDEMLEPEQRSRMKELRRNMRQRRLERIGAGRRTNDGGRRIED